MFDIDPSTRLPVLPEPDMFWRVKEEDPGVFSSIPRHVSVSIKQPRWVRERDDIQIFGITIWIRYKEVVRNKTLATRWISHPGKLEYIHPGNITREDILRTAEAALTQYLNEKDTKSLFGDYPPKTLEVSE